MFRKKQQAANPKHTKHLKMHRDPKRIDRITNLLNIAWKAYPDLRFFQLLDAILQEKDKTDLKGFYKEDLELEKQLSKSLKSLKKTTKRSFPEL